MEEREAKIMSEIAEGNLSAFKELVELYQRPIINFIVRFIGDKNEAEDIAQEVFLRVFKAAKDCRPKSKFKTWLFKIAANLCLNEIRDNKNRPQFIDLLELDEAGFLAVAPDTYSPVKVLENKQLTDIIRKAITTLPEKQRIALLLQKYNGFSYEETSQIMGCSVSSVESLIQRARQNMKKMLTHYLEYNSTRYSGRNLRKVISECMERKSEKPKTFVPLFKGDVFDDIRRDNN